MTVTFYTNFSKRRNSTKRPTNADTHTVVTCTLKTPTSIETPTFLLTGVTDCMGYTYAEWGGRYYYVNDVVIESNTLASVTCGLDVLATYKSEIGSGYAFIERCSSGYNSKLTDTAISTQLVPFRNQGIVFPWGGTWDASTFGYVSITAISTQNNMFTPGCGHYIFDPRSTADRDHGGLSYLTDDLFNDATLGLQLVGKLQNVQSAIIRATYIPFMDYSDFSITETAVVLGTTTLNLKAKVFEQYDSLHTLRRPAVYSTLVGFDLSNYLNHATLTDWRNNAPYTTASVYLPFYGTVRLPITEYLDPSATTWTDGNGNTWTCHHVIIQVIVDYVTGDLEYIIYKMNTAPRAGHGVDDMQVIGTYKTSIGVDIPISQIIGSPEKFINSIVGMSASAAGAGLGMMAATGPVGAAVALGGGLLGVASSTVQNIMAQKEANISTAGGGSNTSVAFWRSQPRNIILVVDGMTTNTDTATIAPEYGGPFMNVGQIGTHGGYVKCNNASIDISGHDRDKVEVNSLLNSGIFYE